MYIDIRRTPPRDMKGYQDMRLVHAILLLLYCCSSTKLGSV